MSIIQGTALSAGGFYPYELNQSLRFNDDDSAYLSWTPNSGSDRRTFTFSAWVKLGNINGSNWLFEAYSNGTNFFLVGFDTNYKFNIYDVQGGVDYGFFTSAVYRDTSSWYHVVATIDTTNATSSDRFRLYINGERVTQFGTNYGEPPLNYQTNALNTGLNHSLGHRIDASAYFDGYLSEVNFIDGTALDATSFGEFKDGIWVPKKYGGSYGTNGFYLPFNNDYSVEGFNTVTYRGNGGTQYIGGVGFEPDLVWIKRRDTAASHAIFDFVRGTNKVLNSNLTNSEASDSGDGFSSFDPDGFTVTEQVSASGQINTDSMVAWAWDMGTGSAASNTDGSITSTVKASPTYGQSVVGYTGNGSSGATIGHGLSSAPEMVIVKARNYAYNWAVYSSDIGATKYLVLDATAAAGTASSMWNDTSPTSSVVTLGSDNWTNLNGGNYIAYCFHSVAGYSDFGSYTGNGSTTGPIVTTGFKPAFVMIKNASSGSTNWVIKDNTREPETTIDSALEANTSTAEQASLSTVDFLSDGFQIKNTGSYTNTSGDTYIYMAFADKREAAFWLDQSGNNNDWTNNNMQESDISLDNPTNNFATLNVLANYTGGSLSEGNLRVSTGSTQYGPAPATFAQSSGKWYAEFSSTSTSGDTRIGAVRVDAALSTTYDLGNSGSFAYRQNDGNKKIDGTQSAYGATWAASDIIGIALNLDDNEVTFYKNNTSQGTFSITAGEYFIAISDGDSGAGGNYLANFGQDSSFAGNKVAQGNVDANGRGDFYYEPPAGYLALCTANLPEPAILDAGQHFNTVLYTGNGSTQSITGLGFQPDFTWIKERTTASAHGIYDVVRGNSKVLSSNGTWADYDQSSDLGLESFDTDGFTVDYPNAGDYYINRSGQSYVAWNWKADNTSGTTNTDGSITSTVSANPTAGFSIVNFVSTGSAGTVGHGLSQAPELIIAKQRPVASAWAVYSAEIGATKRLQLQTTDAAATDSSWNNTAPTSSVFSQALTSTAGRDIICYCFHSVEGYSKFGSYTGNGSADGPFVYTGFRPAFVIIKRTDSTANWTTIDNTRDTYNIVNHALFPDLSNAEQVGTTSGYTVLDFLSNGFKYRQTTAAHNASGGTYIYMAFAENPFKYSNAR